MMRILARKDGPRRTAGDQCAAVEISSRNQSVIIRLSGWQSQTHSRCIKRTHGQRRRISEFAKFRLIYREALLQATAAAKCPGPLFGRPGHWMRRLALAGGRQNLESGHTLTYG